MPAMPLPPEGPLLPRRRLLRRLAGVLAGALAAPAARAGGRPEPDPPEGPAAPAASDVSEPPALEAELGPPAASPAGLRHVLVAAAPDRFLAWPANHGIWSWDRGREIMVGHGEGPWVEQEGHKIGQPQRNRLVRSLDGGLTWTSDPPGQVPGNEDLPLRDPPRLPLDAPGFVLRVVVSGPPAAGRRMGRFFVSSDRGRSWRGPYRFRGLEEDPRLAGLTITSRTSYVVEGPQRILLLLSAQDPRLGAWAGRLDKPFVAESRDGGRSFRFRSWVVPWSDPFRAVMPATLRIRQGHLVTALRRMNPRDPEQECWIDTYASRDGGATWAFASRVGDTGPSAFNGNPPALARLRDGRLACAYGDRGRQRLVLRCSDDGGRSWGEEWLLRQIPFTRDMGYPQLTQNHRGEIVVVYYLATRERPQSFVEAALLPPPP